MSSDRLKLLANPFGTKINTSSNNTTVLVYLCDVPNGLADNFNFSDDLLWIPVSVSSYEAPDSASRLVSFDADSYSHNVEVRSGDAESGASYTKVVGKYDS